MVVAATGPYGVQVASYLATASDPVSGVVLTYSRPPGSIFSLGTTTVTVTATATDGSHNSSSATFTVTVVDLTPPMINAPNIVVEATSPAGASVHYNVTASDAVGSVTSLTVSAPQNSIFAIGTTTVYVTAIDNAGNVATTSFTVTVRVTKPPVITSVSPNLTVRATSKAGAIVSYKAATASDAVAPFTITYSKASGTTFPIGTTTVTVTATDIYGNSSTATFRVTVLPPG